MEERRGRNWGESGRPLLGCWWKLSRSSRQTEKVEKNRKQVQLDRLLVGMQQQQEAMAKNRRSKINAQLMAEITRLKSRDMIAQR